MRDSGDNLVAPARQKETSSPAEMESDILAAPLRKWFRRPRAAQHKWRSTGPPRRTRTPSLVLGRRPDRLDCGDNEHTQGLLSGTTSLLTSVSSRLLRAIPGWPPAPPNGWV